LLQALQEEVAQDVVALGNGRDGMLEMGLRGEPVDGKVELLVLLVGLVGDKGPGQLEGQAGGARVDAVGAQASLEGWC
jgi:hypothetical protein